MCGRYSNTGRRGDPFQVGIAERLRVARPESDDGFERFNIAPTDEVLAVVQDQTGRRMTLLGWGLVRGWADAAKPRTPLINARAETVRERPAYRDLVAKAENRCLVLADGWYEWQGPRTPASRGGRSTSRCRTGRRSASPGSGPARAASCTILTCAANDLARPIHDRMPVVLDASRGVGRMARPRARRRGRVRAARAAALARARRAAGKPGRELGSQRRPRLPRAGADAALAARLGSRQ